MGKVIRLESFGPWAKIATRMVYGPVVNDSSISSYMNKPRRLYKNGCDHILYINVVSIPTGTRYLVFCNRCGNMIEEIDETEYKIRIRL